jgi:hypothetical protein
MLSRMLQMFVSRRLRTARHLLWAFGLVWTIGALSPCLAATPCNAGSFDSAYCPQTGDALCKLDCQANGDVAVKVATASVDLDPFRPVLAYLAAPGTAVLQIRQRRPGAVARAIPPPRLLVQYSVLLI